MALGWIKNGEAGYNPSANALDTHKWDVCNSVYYDFTHHLPLNLTKEETSLIYSYFAEEVHCFVLGKSWRVFFEMGGVISLCYSGWPQTTRYKWSSCLSLLSNLELHACGTVPGFEINCLSMCTKLYSLKINFSLPINFFQIPLNQTNIFTEQICSAYIKNYLSILNI
jgi:hypothetical protein